MGYKIVVNAAAEKVAVGTLWRSKSKPKTCFPRILTDWVLIKDSPFSMPVLNPRINLFSLCRMPTTHSNHQPPCINFTIYHSKSRQRNLWAWKTSHSISNIQLCICTYLCTCLPLGPSLLLLQVLSTNFLKIMTRPPMVCTREPIRETLAVPLAGSHAGRRCPGRMLMEWWLWREVAVRSRATKSPLPAWTFTLQF